MSVAAPALCVRQSPMRGIIVAGPTLLTAGHAAVQVDSGWRRTFLVERSRLGRSRYQREFAIDRCHEDTPDARAPSDLRELQQAAPGQLPRGSDLQLRVHLLCKLRGGSAIQRLPKLWRRIHAAADPPLSKLGRRQLPYQRSGKHRGSASTDQPGGASRIFGKHSAHSSRRSVKTGCQPTDAAFGLVTKSAHTDAGAARCTRRSFTRVGPTWTSTRI